ncbi:MAG: UvrD-helicase domain-containing protein [Candidatus Pacearchaeota archaeon]|jgi:superfamily I DNA/RNA helicase
MEKEMIPIFNRDESLDYIKVLNAVSEIPFSVGKNLLIDFLSGDESNDSITKNNLEDLETFNSFPNDKDKAKSFVETLINRGMIEVVSSDINKFWKILKITEKGKRERIDPKMNKKMTFSKTIITEEDKMMFKELDTFLSKFNDSQKKAIISNKDSILCVAGAGSGKTTVLTKRIEFLIKYKGINPDKILAITFTRKARQEMEERLLKLDISVRIETFNSFCEKILINYQSKIYGRPMKVISYQNKIFLTMFALSNLGITMQNAIDRYFSSSQKKNKSTEELSNILMNDCFFILDYFKTKNQEMYDFSSDAELKNKDSAKMIYNICKQVKEQMYIQGLRDYTDQVLDVIKFYKNNKSFIPVFEHLLVDEYQDVNAMQIELLELFSSKNLFCVGDPRQSIFGWRGSDINYIIDFEEKHPGSEIITLDKNYRSNKHIVNFINSSIKDMGLPDLESHYEGKKDINMFNFDSEVKEFEYVISEILHSNIEKEKIFVLARTNGQLSELSRHLKHLNIPHILKKDDSSTLTARSGEVTLATIHSIKGLEAKLVFIIGCNEMNFPCKASDHPVIEMIKIDDYDKEAEERRLFYVALSRARHRLVLTYTGKKPTYFINDEMMNFLGIAPPKPTENKSKNHNNKKVLHKERISEYKEELVDEEKDWGNESIEWRKEEEKSNSKESWEDMISD